MRKFIKFLVYIIAIIVLLFILASILLVTVVNPNDFKNQISQLVHNKTHRELTINGKLSWTFFPSIGLSAENVNLSNTKEFDSNKTFAHIDNVDINIRFAPLLHKKIEIGKLTLNGLTLNLIKNKQGQANWENINASNQPHNAIDSKQTTHSSKPIEFTASDIDIQHAQINYTDEQTNNISQIKEFQFNATDVKMGKTFPVSMQFDFQNNKSSYLGHVTFSSKIDMNQEQYKLNKTKLNAALWKSASPNQKIQLGLNSDINIDLKKKTLNMTDIKSNLDDSHITGYFNITHSDINSVRFDLKVDSLNLDKYLPPQNKTSASIPNNPNQVIAIPSANPSYDGLRKLNLEGTLHADSLTVSNITLSNLVAKIVANKGVINVVPINANLYKGTSSGFINVDVRSNVPSYKINETLSNIQISELTKSEKLTGTANISANVTMQGQHSPELMHNLNGDVKFSINNVVLQGIDIAYQLNRANALLKKTASPTIPDTRKTDFGQMNGSGNFRNGVFYNNDLLMLSPVARITGSGTINASTQALNYHLLAVQMNHGIPGELKIPIIVTGTLSNPILTPDLQSLLKGELTKRIEQIINSPTSKQEIGKQIRRGLMIGRVLHR